MVIWKSAPLGEREKARWPGFLDLFLLPPGLLEAMQREPTRPDWGSWLGGLAAGALTRLELVPASTWSWSWSKLRHRGRSLHVKEKEREGGAIHPVAAVWLHPLGHIALVLELGTD